MLTKVNEFNITTKSIAENEYFSCGKIWRFSGDWDLLISMNLLKTGNPELMSTIPLSRISL